MRNIKTVCPRFTNSSVAVQSGLSLINNARFASSPRSVTMIHCAQRNDHPLHADKVDSIRQRLTGKFPRDSVKELEMIDVINRLALDYLFQQEIGEALHRQHIHFCNRTQSQYSCHGHDLHEVALRFRLLRQLGYDVSSDVTFRPFKGQDGKFKREISGNIQGVMSLFEASHLCMHGEDTHTLEEANALCVQILTAALGNESQTMGNHDAVSRLKLLRTLKHPHHKSLARLTANDLLHELQKEEGWKNDLAELAGLEYGLAHNLYKNETISVTEWWKELGLANKLNLPRDQPVKWYMWTLAALQDPTFSEHRIELTKPISFVYIFDDIFDVSGTLDELLLMTQAVERWEVDSSDKLPEYMKICLKALFHTTAEICQIISFKYGWNPEDSLKKAWVDLFHAFLVESKVLTSKSLPTSEEYLTIGTITSGVPLILMHVLFLLGVKMDDDSSSHILNKSYQRIISSTATILRLSDDLGSIKDESQNEKDGSYIECYMNEHNDVSIDDARQHIVNLILNEWKSLNKDCLLLPHKYEFSPIHSFARGCLNVARTIPLMYDENEKQSFQKLIKSWSYETHI